MDLSARRDALKLKHAELITRHQQAQAQRDAAVAAVSQAETELAIVVGRRMEVDELIADQPPELPPQPPAAGAPGPTAPTPPSKPRAGAAR